MLTVGLGEAGDNRPDGWVVQPIRQSRAQNAGRCFARNKPPAFAGHYNNNPPAIGGGSHQERVNGALSALLGQSMKIQAVPNLEAPAPHALFPSPIRRGTGDRLCDATGWRRGENRRDRANARHFDIGLALWKAGAGQGAGRRRHPPPQIQLLGA